MDARGRRFALHIKRRVVPNCRVVPPSEFNGLIPQSLPIYRESFTTTYLKQTLLKQQILYRKTAHSLSKVVKAKALKQQKLKCLLIISIKHMR